MAALSGLPVERFSFDEANLQAHYSEFRRNEYLIVEDQLNAIRKSLLLQEGSEAEAMKQRITEIKSKYLRPTV